MAVRVVARKGAALEAALDAFAKLRIAVFREWPYLYDGDIDYERRYLEGYARAKGAVLVAAYDGDDIVGAATGMPVLEFDAAIADALRDARFDTPLEDVFYAAESVLLPEYRGQGLGHLFFDERERHAVSLGLKKSVFCAVVRSKDHEHRPASARNLGIFWEKRGYAPLAGITARLSWRDLGDAAETEKTLQFWGRDL